jgi:dTDP-4-amino-4,6-dideoxy-D-galactose acyltransferase
VQIEKTDNMWAYFPLNFAVNREVSSAIFHSELLSDVCAGETSQFVSSTGIDIYYKELKWDSQFFGIPTFRVEFVSVSNKSVEPSMSNSFFEFRSFIAMAHPEFYLFAEIPTEESAVLLGMTGGGWRLIETRITSFRDDIQTFQFLNGRPTRSAVLGDMDTLKATASDAVNPFDRFHADNFFSSSEASNFMATFIENSVKGFADEVIVPAMGPADAFVTGKYLYQLESIGLLAGKNVLTAVSKDRKGWYSHLIGALCNRFKERGAGIALVTTQATNRAVLRVLFEHGFRFGRATHIVATYSRNESKHV